MLDICWLMAALLALLSVPLYFGKGAWLLAGYNRNQDHRREGMDEKLLCRIMAVILDTAAAVFFVGGLGFITLQTASIVALVVVLGGTFFANWQARQD